MVHSNGLSRDDCCIRIDISATVSEYSCSHHIAHIRNSGNNLWARVLISNQGASTKEFQIRLSSYAGHRHCTGLMGLLQGLLHDNKTNATLQAERWP